MNFIINHETIVLKNIVFNIKLISYYFDIIFYNSNIKIQVKIDSILSTIMLWSLIESITNSSIFSKDINQYNSLMELKKLILFY